MVTLFILIANQIAVQCIGADCQQVSYALTNELIKIGVLELIFEVFGFVRIYRRKDDIDLDKEEDEG